MKIPGTSFSTASRGKKVKQHSFFDFDYENDKDKGGIILNQLVYNMISDPYKNILDKKIPQYASNEKNMITTLRNMKEETDQEETKGIID